MAVNAQDFLADIQKAAGHKSKQKPQKKDVSIPDLRMFGIPDGRLPEPTFLRNPGRGQGSRKDRKAFSIAKYQSSRRGCLA